jgi:hypothetical protein
MLIAGWQGTRPGSAGVLGAWPCLPGTIRDVGLLQHAAIVGIDIPAWSEHDGHERFVFVQKVPADHGLSGHAAHREKVAVPKDDEPECALWTFAIGERALEPSGHLDASRRGCYTTSLTSTAGEPPAKALAIPLKLLKCLECEPLQLPVRLRILAHAHHARLVHLTEAPHWTLSPGLAQLKGAHLAAAHYDCARKTLRSRCGSDGGTGNSAPARHGSVSTWGPGEHNEARGAE